MSRYFFSVQAKQDLKQIVDRIARDNPAAARREAEQKSSARQKQPQDFQKWDIPLRICCPRYKGE